MLPQRQESFEKILRDAEPEYHPFPGKRGAVEKQCETLGRIVSERILMGGGENHLGIRTPRGSMFMGFAMAGMEGGGGKFNKLSSVDFAKTGVVMVRI